jgi:hypothetical protein
LIDKVADLIDRVAVIGTIRSAQVIVICVPIITLLDTRLEVTISASSDTTRDTSIRIALIPIVTLFNTRFDEAITASSDTTVYTVITRVTILVITLLTGLKDTISTDL